MSPRDDAHAQVAHLEKTVDDFFTSMDSMLRQASTDPTLGQVSTTIDGGLRDLRVQWDDLMRRVGNFLAHGGDSDRLRNAGDAWTSFGASIGDVAATIAPDQMVTTIGWDGSAAEAYRLIVPAQHDALGQVKASGVAIAASLHSLADHIDNFWITLAAALTAAGFGLGVAAATAVEIVTVPAAIALAVTTIGGVVATVATIYIQCESLAENIETDMRTIRQNLVDIGPQWPTVNATAAAAMRDASVKDGTPSQWRLR